MSAKVKQLLKELEDGVEYLSEQTEEKAIKPTYQFTTSLFSVFTLAYVLVFVIVFLILKYKPPKLVMVEDEKGLESPDTGKIVYWTLVLGLSIVGILMYLNKQ